MAAFVIGCMKIHNRDWMEAYFAQVPGLIERFGGKFVVRGGDPSVLKDRRPCPMRFSFWNSKTERPLPRSGTQRNSPRSSN